MGEPLWTHTGFIINRYTSSWREGCSGFFNFGIMDKPSVLEYLDYRLFLNDTIEWRRVEKVKPFSLSEVSHSLGLKSKSHLHALLHNSQKHPSVILQNQFAKWLRFSKLEEKYFYLLIKLAQAKTIDFKENVFSEISILLDRTKIPVFDPTKYSYFQNWYYPVLRELVVLSDWNGDYKKLAILVEPAISIRQARQAVKDLEELELIVFENDRWRTTEANIVTGNETSSAAIYKYQKDLLSLSQESLIHIPVEEREITTLSFSLPEKHLPELKQKMRHMQEELIHWLNAKQSDDDKVFQLNTQLFPVSKSFENENKKK